MSHTPILFLDYDGVLHPDDVYCIKGQVVLKNNNILLFEWSPLLAEALRPHPQVRIVLSTNWVRIFGFEEARDRLLIELQQRVIGSTWHSSFDLIRWARLSRYEQIAQYLQRHSVKRWLAIDDDVQIWGEEHLEQLIELDPAQGLTQPGKLDELRNKLHTLVMS